MNERVGGFESLRFSLTFSSKETYISVKLPYICQREISLADSLIWKLFIFFFLIENFSKEINYGEILWAKGKNIIVH